MSVTAQLADGTTLEFPDGTDPAVVQATVKRHLGVPTTPADELRSFRQSEDKSAFSNAPTANEQQQQERHGIFGGVPEAAVSLGSGALAGPVSGLAGIAGTMLPGPPGQGADWVQKVQDAMTYQPVSKAGQNIVGAASYLPQKLAQGADVAGKWTTDTTGSPLLGTIVNTALQAAPYAVAPIAGRATASFLKGDTPYLGARGVYQSALKPSIAAQRSGAAARAITTGLGEDEAGSPGLVRQAGFERRQGEIANLEDQMTNVLGPSGARTPVQPVLDRLLPLLEDAMNDTTPAREPRIQAIQNAWDAVLNNPHVAGARDVPVQQAQLFKRAINPQTAGEYGTESGTQAIENAKAIQGGWREGVAGAVPAAADINAQMGPRINLNDLIQERLMRSGNREMFGWSPLAHNPATMATMLAQRSPLVVSAYAHVLNQLGNAAGAAGPMGAAYGGAVQAQADEMRRKRLAQLLGSQ